MRLLLFNFRDILHPDAGGAERMLFELGKLFVRDGHTLIWFAPMFDHAKSEETFEGIHIIRRGNKYTVYLWALVYYILKYKGKVDFVFDSINTIPFFTPLFVREKKASIIYQLGGNILEKTPFANCTDYYNGPFFVFLLSYFIFEPLTLFIYKNTPCFTISNSSKYDLLHFRFQKVFALTLGADVENVRQYKKEKNPTFIFLGRMVGYKKPEDVLQSFQEIQKQIPASHLWMVGSGPLLETLKMKNKSRKHIKFFGYVTERKKYQLLGKSHILLFPSIREGWGLTVIEAAIVKTPTIGYDVHGLRDVIKNDITGFLVKNPEEMALKAVNVIKNKKVYTALANNAYTYGNSFTWKKTYKEFIYFLKKIY